MLMPLKFYKLYPMGNATVLIDNTESVISHEKYYSLSNELMSDDYLACEQVGYFSKGIDDAVYKLDMMGGELCVNALRSLGYLHYFQTKETEFKLRSSGSDSIFNISINNCSPEVSLRFDMAIEHINLSKNLSLVKLQGIAHFVEEIPDVVLSEKQMLDRHAQVIEKYSENLGHIEAVGYVPYKVDEQNGVISIVPLVYVIETDTRVFESSCGSATVAVSVHQQSNSSEEKVSYSIKQPSEAIFVLDLETRSGSSYGVTIASDVKLMAQGEVFIEN